MKRVLSFFLSLILLLGGLSTAAFAAEQETGALLPELTPERDLAEFVLPDGVDVEELSYAIAEGLVLCEPIDLYEFRIPFSQELYQAIGNMIFYSLPEAFHVTEIGGSTMNGYFDQIKPNYNCNSEEYLEKYNACRVVTERLTADLVGNEELTDAEKALLLHDRLAVHCEYDTSLMAPNCHNMYGALVNGVAVCQGYAMAYMYLLREVDIPSSYVSSALLNHGWNLVEIDGKEYHVDVTWDDPAKDITGRVNHENFLLSGQGIIESGHHKNGYVDYDYSQSSKIFENAYWRSSQAEIQLVDGFLYYIDHEDEALKWAGDGRVLCSVEDTWKASASSSWPGNYARLGSDSRDPAGIYYTQTDGVYRYDLRKGTEEKIWAPDLSGGEYFAVYGFTYRDGTLICDVYNSPNFTAVAYGYRQTKDYTYSPPKVVTGDANGDSLVNFSDIQRIYQHLSAGNRLVGDALSAADANKDGTVSFSDIQRIYQHLSGGAPLK